MNNKEWKKLLNLDEQTSAVISGHAGAKGNRVDNPFMGPFTGTPNLIIPLKQQLKDREQKRKEMEDIVGKDHVGLENPVGGYFEVEKTNDLSYKEIDDKAQMNIDFNLKATPQPDLEWKLIHSDIKFDKFTKEIDIDTYTNSTNQMKELTKTFENNLKTDIKKIEKYKNPTNKMKKIDLDDIYRQKIKKANKDLVNKTDKWQKVPNLSDIYGEL